MTTDEIHDLARQYATAASNTIEVGCDGVELHSANGYPLHEFLSSNATQRSDDCAGNIENRVRVPRKMLDAVIAAIGAGTTGLRVSPGHTFNDIVEDDVPERYALYLKELDKRGLAYLHVMRRFANEATLDLEAFANEHFRGKIINCGGYDQASSTIAVAERRAGPE